MMEEDAQALAEVVIIGYGTTIVKDVTGAVSAVTSEDFNGGVICSPEQLIQGKTAGVQISQGSGESGSGVSIRIRGTSSEGTDISVGSISARNPLSFLNPNDI